MVDKIPKIIHFIWIDFNNESNTKPVIPKKYHDNINGCIEKNPDFEVKIWDGNKCLELIKDHYPWFLDTYNSYPLPIIRCDAIRYFILHHYGGIYSDVDRVCLKGYQGLIDKYHNYDVILGFEKIVLGNDFMVTKKNSDFMYYCMVHLRSAIMVPMYEELSVLFTAGPFYLSRCWLRYKGPEKIKVLKTEIMPCKYCDKTESFSYPENDSTWMKNKPLFIIKIIAPFVILFILYKMYYKK